MRRILFAMLLLLTPSFVFAAQTPVVNSGAINYTTNQITLTGSGFLPAKAAPSVLVNNIKATVVSDTATQIVATLPAGLTAGTFIVSVTNSQGNVGTFDVAYGAIGPQGPAGAPGPVGSPGPAGAMGPAGATGPRGIAGAPGAPGASGAQGPAGTNGTSFTFLNAFDAYATYAADSVVTYNGSSYIAIVPNGPNPTGPTPDQNPSWSPMAMAGSVGPAGPVGTQGPIGAPGLTGMMGNPGPAGPGGPAGPQGPTGGVLSWVGNTASTSPQIQRNPGKDLPPTVTNSITLNNPGVYVLGGAQILSDGDTSGGYATITCQLQDGLGTSGLPSADGFIMPTTLTTLPINGYYFAQSVPVTLTLTCSYVNAPSQPVTDIVVAIGGSLTAIQVQ
jgi:hypothetical protein